MLVYGETSVDGDLREWWQALGALLRNVSSRERDERSQCGEQDEQDRYDDGAHGTAGTFDALRLALVTAGEIEQAVHDRLAPQASWSAHPLVCRCHLVTFALAQAFCSAAHGEAARASERARDLLAGPLPASLALRFKVPEGFAFYGLFPEQYAGAAEAWLDGHRGVSPRRATVIGIRSIGTTLGAVVAAALVARGFDVALETVRPWGHPFARELDLRGWSVDPRRPVLVVDEGPGLSGSSFAAVAEALTRLGVPPEAISFLPSHAGEPGPQASEPVRRWWRRVRRFVAKEEMGAHAARQAAARLDARRHGAMAPGATTLGATMCGSATLGAAGQDRPPAAPLEDLGAGRWRSRVSREASWPTACARFEKPKYRLATPAGTLLLKFAGLDPVLDHGELRTRAAEIARGLARRAEVGAGPPVRAAAHGYVALDWIDGTLVEPGTAVDLPELSRYLAATAGPPLVGLELRRGAARLVELVQANSYLAKVSVPHDRIAHAAQQILHLAPLPAATDYDLGPAHWLVSASWRRWKLGGRGASTLDHTAVGMQSVLWSTASAAIEWGLSASESWALARAVVPSSGAEPAMLERALWLHCAAYASFRLALCTLCAETTSEGDPERSRLVTAAEGYRQILRSLTREPLSPTSS